jgi:NitT/TauT family transport system permease protein
MSSKIRIFTYCLLAVLLLLAWQYAAENNTVRVLLSSPSLIFAYFIENIDNLWEATYITFYESIAGLLIATLFSFGTMIVCFYFPKLMEFVLPLLVVSQVVPLITLAPLFIILFGVGLTAKIFMAALLCFFPIFVNFANGVKLIPKNINELLYIYNANTTQKIRHVYFALALPNIMTGLKIAATLAVIGAIVAEFNGAEIGLGKNLFLAAKRLESELMMCCLFLSTLLGGIMYGLIVLVERRLGRWYL